jgi:hypothetical protein
MPYEVSHTHKIHLVINSGTISENILLSSLFERLNISKRDEAGTPIHYSTTTRTRGARGEVLNRYPAPNAPTRTAPNQTILERQALTMP